MIPSHSSGICACVYHLFYNAPSVGYVVILQALLTFIGNSTLAFAAYRLAASNGWTFRGALPAALQGDSPSEAPPPPIFEPSKTQPLDGMALPTILLFTVLGSYIVKYGETMVPFVFTNDLVAPGAFLHFVSPAAVAPRTWGCRARRTGWHPSWLCCRRWQ